MTTVVERETEYTDDDVALLLAQMEYEADLGPHGQPMSEATSGDADPMLRGKGHQYVAYHSTDYAAEALRLGPILLKRDYPDMTDDQMGRLIWGVRKVPKPPMPETQNG